MPAYQGLADRLLAPPDRPRDRGQRVRPGTSSCASGTCRPRASGSSGTARRSTSSPVRRRERARRCAPALGPRPDAPVDRHHRPPVRAEGPARPAGCRRARSSAPTPRARFVLVGDGDLRPALEAQAAALGLATRVRVRGPPHGRARRCSAALDVVCISSTYEGTPLALFEAMAAGRAIVSTAVDGCREVLEDGRTALCSTPPRDAGALAAGAPRVLADAALRAAAGRRRRRRVAPLRHRGVRAADRGALRRGARPSARAEPPREPALAGAAGRGRLGGAARPAARPLSAVRDGRAAAAQPRAGVRLPPVEPVSFERRLDFLEENGYVTLSAEEYFQFLLGARPAPERAVVLTFDDGRGSLWSVGAPLLERRGMRGIVFLVPGRTTARPGPPLPTWTDVARGPRRRGRGRRPGTTGAPALLGGDPVAVRARRVRLPEPHAHPRAHPHRPRGGRLRHAGAPPRLRRVRPAARDRPRRATTCPPPRCRSGARSSPGPRARPTRCASARRRSSGAPRSRRWPLAAARRSSRGPAGSRSCVRSSG